MFFLDPIEDMFKFLKLNFSSIQNVLISLYRDDLPTVLIREFDYIKRLTKCHLA